MKETTGVLHLKITFLFLLLSLAGYVATGQSQPLCFSFVQTGVYFRACCEAHLTNAE